MSGEVVLMSPVGGFITIFGPVAGAAVIITIRTTKNSGAWVTDPGCDLRPLRCLPAAWWVKSAIGCAYGSETY
jgi:ABC-type branched-subunit amino acid transport system permease subunit